MYRQFLADDLWADELDYAAPQPQRSRWQRLRDRARRLGVIMRIVGLTTSPLQEPALPPPPPPAVRVDNRNRGASGSQFDDFDAEAGDALAQLEDEFDSLIDLLEHQFLAPQGFDAAAGRRPWRRRRTPPAPRPTTALQRAQQMLQRSQQGLQRSEAKFQRAARQQNWALASRLAGAVERAEAAVVRWRREVERLQISRGPYR